MKKIKEFIQLTAIDFKTCWECYPNVIIWCALLFLIALFL
jgi:hypothetical protein